MYFLVNINEKKNLFRISIQIFLIKYFTRLQNVVDAYYIIIYDIYCMFNYLEDM